MHRLRTVTYFDVSAVAGHHAMPAALLFSTELCNSLKDHEENVSTGGKAITKVQFADDKDALAEEEQELEAQ